MVVLVKEGDLLFHSHNFFPIEPVTITIFSAIVSGYDWLSKKPLVQGIENCKGDKSETKIMSFVLSLQRLLGHSYDSSLTPRDDKTLILLHKYMYTRSSSHSGSVVLSSEFVRP